jgi:undecaprenyl-diphosphatase
MSYRRLLVLAAIPAVLFATLTALVVVRASPVLKFDSAISSAAWRAATGHGSWRSFETGVTNTGGPAVVTVMAVAATLALLGFRRWRDAGFVAVTMLGSASIRLIVLNLVARPRPVDRLAPAAGFSFPSGHTTGSAAAALTAVAVLWPLLRRRRRVVFAVVAGLWAAAVGVSRVALVVHWPTDVLGAWLLTVTVVVLALPLREPSRRSQPGANHGDAFGGGDGRGRAEHDGHGEGPGEAATTGSTGGAVQGPQAADDDPAADTR